MGYTLMTRYTLYAAYAASCTVSQCWRLQAVSDCHWSWTRVFEGWLRCLSRDLSTDSSLATFLECPILLNQRLHARWAPARFASSHAVLSALSSRRRTHSA